MHKQLKIAVAAVVAGAVALPASGALAASKTERAIIGAILGGVAGAALTDGRGSGVALGAVAGAALGSATAKDHNYRSGYRTSYTPSRPYYSDNRYSGYDRYNDNGYYGQTRYDRSRYDRYDNNYGYRR